MKKQAEADGKSALRLKQLANALDRLAESFNVEVHALTPKMIVDYLTALALAERTRRNHHDVIGFFNRWLVLRGYLAKGADWLEGVQNYTTRKLGQIPPTPTIGFYPRLSLAGSPGCVTPKLRGWIGRTLIWKKDLLRFSRRTPKRTRTGSCR